MFPRSVSSFHPDTARLIFLHNTAMVGIIRRYYKEFWIIRRGGQSNNRVFRGNRDGIGNYIWGIPGSFMWAGYIISGNGR